MKTYFIRHSAEWDVEAEFRHRLWAERKIAIRFEDLASANPSDYHTPAAQRGVRTFAELAQHGGLVCATISPYAGCLVARLAPGTPITFEECRYPNAPGRTGIVKVISLPNAREVPPDKANRLLIGQPQQGTICVWNIIGDRVKHFIEHGDVRITEFSDLLPHEQEVLCSEFLRTPAATLAGLPRLAHLSAPVGRTRKAVDIAGVTEQGLPIFVQVTHHQISDQEIKRKAQALRDAARASGGDLILFCRSDAPSQQAGVCFFPTQRVFDEMKQLPAWRAAIGIPEVSP